MTPEQISILFEIPTQKLIKLNKPSKKKMKQTYKRFNKELYEIVHELILYKTIKS
jgi:hypothetical protein